MESPAVPDRCKLEADLRLIFRLFARSDVFTLDLDSPRRRQRDDRTPEAFPGNPAACLKRSERIADPGLEKFRSTALRRSKVKRELPS